MRSRNVLFHGQLESPYHFCIQVNFIVVNNAQELSTRRQNLPILLGYSNYNDLAGCKMKLKTEAGWGIEELNFEVGLE